jgi:hypothetical protein
MKNNKEEKLNADKADVMFSLPAVERMIRYALWIQELGYDFPHIHRKRTKDEIFVEVLQTAIDAENAESYKSNGT